MNINNNKSPDYFLKAQRSIFQFCSSHTTSTKIFSPLIGVTVSILRITLLLGVMSELALKAIACFGLGLFCCSPSTVLKGFVFTLATIGMAIIIPFFSIYCIFLGAFDTYKLLCDTSKHCQETIAELDML